MNDMEMMDVTVTIGWWAVPAFTTLAAICIALRDQPAPSGTDYGAGGVIGCVFLMMALVVSLVAWLILALVA